MPPKNSGGWTKFPGGHKVIHRTAQTAFVRVVIPREEDLGGGGQYYYDGDADYVKESDENNEDVPLVGHCGRAHYADNDDVEDEEDNLEVIAFPESDGSADYGEESDEDSEEELGGGGYYTL